jgi:hypothetical protein
MQLALNLLEDVPVDAGRHFEMTSSLSALRWPVRR